VDKRQQIILRASWVAIAGNALLALLKIVIGLFAGSMAVVADGIDSATDIATSTITLVTAKIMSRPPNIKYPYGYEKADTIATKVLSFIIFFAGAQLAISSVERIVEGRYSELPSWIAVYVTIFSIVSKLSLSVYLRTTGKRANSSMLIANAKNMQNDVITSASVLAGLFFVFVLHLPVLDLITALLVSIWIMRVALKMFFETNLELMDGMQDPVFYCELFKAVKTVPGAENPHRVRVRKLGSYHMISMDIEVEPDLSVREAHEIAQKVESEIRRSLPNVYDIVVHVEPRGDDNSQEKFGLREKDIENLN
jgi:cation diffusion facilitator family transporter